MNAFKIFKYHGGFTLIESLVALSILMVVLTASLSGVSRSLSDASDIRDRITATYLNQDALEFLRMVRDTNAFTPDDPDPTKAKYWWDKYILDKCYTNKDSNNVLVSNCLVNTLITYVSETLPPGNVSNAGHAFIECNIIVSGPKKKADCGGPEGPLFDAKSGNPAEPLNKLRAVYHKTDKKFLGYLYREGKQYTFLKQYHDLDQIDWSQSHQNRFFRYVKIKVFDTNADTNFDKNDSEIEVTVTTKWRDKSGAFRGASLTENLRKWTE